MNGWPIPLSGVLCRGECVEIGWPEPAEFDAITLLRNAARVRTWFLNDRVLDIVENRTWLETGMRRPVEAVLAIRWRESGAFLGFCGWSDWDRKIGCVELGRFALDLARVAAGRAGFPETYRGVALDCGITMRDFAFRRMGVARIVTSHFAANRTAARINRGMGLRPVKRHRCEERASEIVYLELLREEWKRGISR